MEGSAVFAEWPFLTPSIRVAMLAAALNKDKKHAHPAYRACFLDA